MPLLIVGAVFCTLGAIVHGYIFWLEAIAWTGARARRIFGLDAEEARVTAPLARNQGFYNLFLAIDVLVGLGLLLTGAESAAITALLIGAGSMVAAGLVLVATSPALVRAAATQAALPLIGVVLVIAGALAR